MYQNNKFSYILNLMMRNFIFVNAQTALTCLYRLIELYTCLGLSVQWSNGKWNSHLKTADLQLKSELSSIPLSPGNHLYLGWYQNSWILAMFSFYVPVSLTGLGTTKILDSNGRQSKAACFRPRSSPARFFDRPQWPRAWNKLGLFRRNFLQFSFQGCSSFTMVS